MVPLETGFDSHIELDVSKFDVGELRDLTFLPFTVPTVDLAGCQSEKSATRYNYRLFNAAMGSSVLVPPRLGECLRWW